MLSLLSIALPLVIVAICMVPLGSYMANVYTGKHVLLTPVLGWLERLIYRLCGIDVTHEMNWREYTAAVLIFGFGGALFLFLIFLFQQHLPLNPQNFAALTPDLAFNVAVSFVTNTNWQNYGGESTLSYFSQMAGCTVQNFLSATTGMAVAVALFRGLARKQTEMIGNFWIDTVRSLIYILLPATLVFAIFLVSQGMIQNFDIYTAFKSLEGADGLIAQGPVASQVAIKMLGSNGGGYFNTNGAHPFENPTSLSNMFQIASILLISVALVFTYGLMVNDRRQAWSILAAMLIIFAPLLLLGLDAEHKANPKFSALPIEQSAGNMEGKEVRFGVDSGVLWAAATTATSNGSVNAMHDSFMPLAGLVPMVLMQFGEVVFGGVGSGIYGMLVFVIITTFVGGLMVGRTPEYLGKKLGAFEIKMASLAMLIPSAFILLGTAIALSTEAGRAGISNPGPQGFSEVLYAFSSAANNNGSAFAGLSANTPFYNILLGIVMLAGRYGVILPVIAIGGTLAAKNTTPQSVGTLPTHTLLFTLMLVGTIVLVGILTFIPALALGPYVEHLHLFAGAVK